MGIGSGILGGRVMMASAVACVQAVWAGVSYKSSKQIVLLTQAQLTDQIQFGYSYTISAGKIRYVETGSHEIMVNYRFKYIKKGVVSPRYF